MSHCPLGKNSGPLPGPCCVPPAAASAVEAIHRTTTHAPVMPTSYSYRSSRPLPASVESKYCITTHSPITISQEAK